MLGNADLALLVGARIRLVNALSLSRWDKGHHPGGKDDWVGEDTAWLVADNNAAVMADAELCAEHIRENGWSRVRNDMTGCSCS